MSELSRTPVVVTAGQETNRSGDPSAYDLLETASRKALQAKADLKGRLTDAWVVSSLSMQGDTDPAGELGRRLDLGGIDLRNGGSGGAIPQWLANRAAESVVRGERPVVLITGAEALATRKRLQRTGALDNMLSSMREAVEAGSDRPPPAPTFPPMETDPGAHSVELAHGLGLPTHMYALAESAITHVLGDTTQRHLERMGALMERFNDVAAKNPYSWFPTRRTTEELITPTEVNRRICAPFTKYLCAIMDVDMAAGFVVTDAQTARELGFAADEVAYLAGWSDAKDIWYVSERPQPARSLAIQGLAETALGMAEATIDEVTSFDLYAAFPASVEAGMLAMGIGFEDPRPLTLTGGLAYHGGAGNNYVSHAICNALDRVRSGSDETVLVHGNGYFLTKHAVGVFQSRPPAETPTPREDVQAMIDTKASPVPLDGLAEGRGTIIAYTVNYERSGEPGDAIVVCEIDRARTVAIGDEELRDALLDEDLVGSTIKVTAGNPRNRVVAG